MINVATGGRVSLLQLFAALKALAGAHVEPVFGPPREGDVRDSQADISLAKELLGYAPSVGFEEGLKRTVAWFTGAS